MTTLLNAVGRSVPRKDGIGKATGTARYADDLHFPGMLFGRTIRTTIPCGLLTGVRLEFDPAGFTVVDHRDIPGRNIVALITDDQPCLAEREIRHAAEPVLLLAHENREVLLGARVSLVEEPREPVFDPERSPTAFKTILIEKGDLGAGFSAADGIVEGTYRTGHQEHVYIEPQGVIAVPEDGGITVYGSIQCPFYAHRALATVLGDAVSRVRVVQTETGGGFGGKEEYPSGIAAHAALLALKSGRPVKLVYDRVEDMVATTKRHPAIVRHRTGLTRDGRLVAMDIEVILDGGAYVTLSPVVLSRGAIHAAGPYRCDERPDRRPGDVHQHAAQRSVPRLRRPADPVRSRGPHGARRGGARSRPGSPAGAQPAPAGRHHRDGPAHGRRLQRARSAAHRGAPIGLPPQAQGVRGNGPRASVSRCTGTAPGSPGAAS